MLLEIAGVGRRAGANMLRGGAYKPRTSPYEFQGLGVRGLKFLAEAREKTGLPVVTEVLSWEEVPVVARYADVLQIGARNMQNFALLRAAGRGGKPVLLKRGGGATIEEWLSAAEYILADGNDQRDPLRARHPDVRAGHAPHPRPERRRARAGAHAPAGPRGSEPRRRHPLDRRAARPGRPRGRRARGPGRGPPGSRSTRCRTGRRAWTWRGSRRSRATACRSTALAGRRFETASEDARLLEEGANGACASPRRSTLESSAMAAATASSATASARGIGERELQREGQRLSRQARRVPQTRAREQRGLGGGPIRRIARSRPPRRAAGGWPTSSARSCASASRWMGRAPSERTNASDLGDGGVVAARRAARAPRAGRGRAPGLPPPRRGPPRRPSGVLPTNRAPGGRFAAAAADRPLERRANRSGGRREPRRRRAREEQRRSRKWAPPRR